MPVAAPALNPATLAGVAIFVGTLVAIVARPAWTSEAQAASLGGALMILFGLVSPGETAAIWLGQANIFGFFLGLMLIAALAEEAGFFEEMARIAVKRSRGSPRRLLVNVFLVGTGITAVLSNDATALVLTPIVYVIVVRLRLDPTPFVFACTFVADAASFILPVSNPVNVIILEPFAFDLADYLRHLLLPASLVVGVNVALFLVIFRRHLGGRVDVSRLAAPPIHVPLLRDVHAALGVIAVGYLAAAACRWPLAAVALGGAGLLAVVTVRHGRLVLGSLARSISWSIFPFIAGMLVVVRGVENLGLTTAFAAILTALAGGSTLGASLVGVGGVALGSNLINNVPMALVMVSALGGLPAELPERAPLVYASILGAALGPNVSVAGSLATMLWLLILRRRGLEVSSLHYLRLGLAVTIPALLVGSFALWLTFLGG